MLKLLFHRHNLVGLFILQLMIIPTEGFSETSLWKSVGSWDISFYENKGGCTAYTVYDGGIAFFIGLSKYGDTLNFEMTLMNESWKSIEDQKEYEVVVTLGNEIPWKLEMTGVKFDSTWGMNFVTPASSEDSGKFVEEFMREVSMKWTYNGQQLGHLSLANSRAAFEEAVACTKSYQDALTNMEDPFSSGATTKSSDPFAN